MAIRRREFIQRSVTGFLGASIVFAGNRAQAQISDGNKKPFKGIFPIMQSPFRDDETIDTECLRKEVNFIVEAGGHGMTWPQIASEFNVLTDEERFQTAELIVKEARGRIPVIIGVQSTNYWKTSLDFARHAEKIGADGIISLPPYQKRPGEEDVVEYFKTLARTVSLPIFIQNSGGQYGPALSVDMIISLAREYPTISYVKEEATPVLERITEIVQKGKGIIQGVYSGAGGTNLLNELNSGSRGSCPAAGLIDVFAEVFNLYDSGDKEKAEKLFSGLNPMFNYRGRGMHWIIKEKEILRRRGIFKNTKSRIAPDFVWRDNEAKTAFDEAYNAIQPLFKLSG